MPGEISRSYDGPADESETLPAWAFRPLGKPTTAADDWRATLNAICALVGHPPISPEEHHTFSVAEAVGDRLRALRRLQEVEAGLPDWQARFAAGSEHHEEHHRTEDALRAEVERLRALHSTAVEAMLDAAGGEPLSDEQVERMLKKAKGELPVGRLTHTSPGPEVGPGSPRARRRER